MPNYRLIHTRQGWFDYYAARFNRHGREDSLHMALFYWFLLIELGENRHDSIYVSEC